MGATNGVFFQATFLLIVLALGSWLIFRSWRSGSVWRPRAINAALLALSLLTVFVAAEGWFSWRVDVTDARRRKYCDFGHH